MNVIKWHGLDLPEFPTEDALCLDSQYIEAAASGHAVLYTQKIETTGPKKSLKDRISRVSKHLGFFRSCAK